MKNKIKLINRATFYALIFLIPLNLGYHFALKQSYVNGILIDYLIPTLYIQDILSVILLVLNFNILSREIRNIDKYLAWFLFSVFLSVLASDIFIVALTHLVRLLIYVGVMLVVKGAYRKEDFKKDIVKVVGVWIVMLSVMAVFQWRWQSAVFDNYLFFGEQPYSSSTVGINIENFFGTAKVPPYGTFRHPNIFGGILSIVLIWMLFYWKKNWAYKFIFILGAVTLFFTLSKFSWISFLLGFVFYFLLRRKDAKVYKIALWTTGLVVFLSLLLPYVPKIPKIYDKPSFYRRDHLLQASYRMIEKKPLFGFGYGLSTAYIEKFLPLRHDIRFSQPTHNMFVLLLAESGVFSLLFFSLYLFKKLRSAVGNKMLFISLVQIMFLGMFDHYFFTMHQPQLLFWVIMGLI